MMHLHESHCISHFFFSADRYYIKSIKRKKQKQKSFFSGFQSYIVLTTEEILLDVENSSRVILYYFITYGLSFTIVAISLYIDPSAYTIKADACVWMEQNYLFYVSFVMPCCIYILVIVCYDKSKKNT